MLFLLQTRMNALNLQAIDVSTNVLIKWDHIPATAKWGTSWKQTDSHVPVSSDSHHICNNYLLQLNYNSMM